MIFPDCKQKNGSIVEILKVDNLKFSNELVYECDKNLNYYLMEYGISELCENDIKVYNMVKEITKEGQYNYIKIEEEDPQGYVIKANKEIKKNTLIYEYVGDVLMFQELCVKIIKNDSIMDLIWTPQSETSLVICLHKNSNMSRFISG